MTPSGPDVFYQALKKYFGEENLRKIQRVRVGIAGLGGLGSNCAQALVRSGFRLLTLCDFDVVDASNLNRQFYFTDQIGRRKTEALRENLLRINAGLDLTLVDERLTEANAAALFSGCDCVIEAFDNAECKQIIASAYARSGKFFVSASGLAGWRSDDSIVTRRMHDAFYLIGDLRTGVAEKSPPCAPRVYTAAAKQAGCVLSWALGE